MNKKEKDSRVTDTDLSPSFCDDKHFPPGIELVPLLRRTTSSVLIKGDDLLTNYNTRVRAKHVRRRATRKDNVGKEPIENRILDESKHLVEDLCVLDVVPPVKNHHERCLVTTSNDYPKDESTLDRQEKGTKHHLYLPLLSDSLEQGQTLPPDLFQPCPTDWEETDDADVPPATSSKKTKELKRIARKKKLESVRNLEQSEQRKVRFLKRQKRLDADDGVPTVPKTKDGLSSPKSKKKVMWQDNNLFQFHIYSPVTVEDRELTPVISTS